jgi:16S rRNA (guanine527-N7)-methyltransferase
LWNEKINLVSYTGDRELAARHFLDSLAGSQFVPTGARAADIGSGAGFPGMILALARPDVEFLLIESIEKKAAFLRHMRRTLRLSNVEVIPSRAENVEPAGFQIVMGRAVAPPESFVRTAKIIAAPGGMVLVWASAQDGRGLVGNSGKALLRYRLPGSKVQRMIVGVSV